MQRATLSKLIMEIDKGRQGNLSSAIRLFVLDQMRFMALAGDILAPAGLRKKPRKWTACQCSRADEQGFSRPEVPRQARAPSPNPGTVHRTQVCLGGAGSGSKPPMIGAHPRVGGRKEGCRRANLSIRAAQSLFPEFDDFRRKFTPSNSGASAGFRPHFKQRMIFAQ